MFKYIFKKIIILFIALVTCALSMQAQCPAGQCQITVLVEGDAFMTADPTTFEILVNGVIAAAEVPVANNAAYTYDLGCLNPGDLVQFQYIDGFGDGIIPPGAVYPNMINYFKDGYQVLGEDVGGAAGLTPGYTVAPNVPINQGCAAGPATNGGPTADPGGVSISAAGDGSDCFADLAAIPPPIGGIVDPASAASTDITQCFTYMPSAGTNNFTPLGGAAGSLEYNSDAVMGNDCGGFTQTGFTFTNITGGSCTPVNANGDGSYTVADTDTYEVCYTGNLAGSTTQDGDDICIVTTLVYCGVEANVPPPVCTSSAGSMLVSAELCEGDNFGITLNGCTIADQTGFILAYDFDPTTVPTQAELYDGLLGGPSDPGDIAFFGEYSDCTDNAFADLVGFTVPGCDIVSLDIYVIPSNADFTIDPSCAAEGPLSLTYYPTLTAAITADASAMCGDVTVELQTINEADGSTVVCEPRTLSCVSDGPLNFDFSDAFADPVGCSTLTASATCANCAVNPPMCNISNVGLSAGPCDDNGTTAEDDTQNGDDTFVLTINPVGMDVGTTYTISGGATGTGMYGTPFTVSLPADGSSITITITDDMDNMCTLNANITAPMPCSNTAQPPATDIPTLSQWGLITLMLLLMSYGAIALSNFGKLSAILKTEEKA